MDASFWDFCSRCGQEGFGANWCFSSEQSLLLHAKSTLLPKQVIIWSPNGSGNDTTLPFDTSLYDLKKELPSNGDIIAKDGLCILSVEAALINVPEVFYRTYPTEAQIIQSNLKNTNLLLSKILGGGHVAAAGALQALCAEWGATVRPTPLSER